MSKFQKGQIWLDPVSENAIKIREQNHNGWTFYSTDGSSLMSFTESSDMAKRLILLHDVVNIEWPSWLAPGAWLARDEDDSLYVFEHYPENHDGTFNSEKGSVMELQEIDDSLEEITYENSPVQVPQRD